MTVIQPIVVQWMVNYYNYDAIKTCENLHVEEQHQLKILLQKYEHLFDRTLGEFNMEPISLQLMD
jgi:hypothetical protein